MARTGCIRHPARTPIAVIRGDMVAVAGGDHCLAATVQYFEYWTDVKLAQREQARTANAIALRGGDEAREDESLWIYATAEAVSESMSGLFARNRVGEALRRAVEGGLLERRNNPRYAWDRTLQYRLSVQELQRRIDALEAGAEPGTGGCNAPNRAINSTNEGDQSPDSVQAIPKTSPETSSLESAAALRSAAEDPEGQPQGQGQEHSAGPGDPLDRLRSGGGGGKDKVKGGPPGRRGPPQGGGLGGGGFGSRAERPRAGERPEPVNWVDAVPENLRPAAEAAGKGGWAWAFRDRPARERDWAKLEPEKVRDAVARLDKDYPGKKPMFQVAEALDALGQGAVVPLLDNQRAPKERITRSIDPLHPQQWMAVVRLNADGSETLLRHEPREDQR